MLRTQVQLKLYDHLKMNLMPLRHHDLRQRAERGVPAAFGQLQRGGDDKSREYIFKTLRARKVTIINSTHDPEKFLDIDSHFHIEIENEKRIIIQKT